MTFSSSSSKMCWDNGIWRKLLFPLRVMSWWILHYTEWEHTSHLQLKDGHDHHPNWLAWYYWCIVLTKLGVSFNERDLTDCLFLLIRYRVQRVLECSLFIVFSTGRLLLFRSSQSVGFFRLFAQISQHAFIISVSAQDKFEQVVRKHWISLTSSGGNLTVLQI